MRAKRLPLGLKKTKHNRMMKRLMVIALSLFVVFSQMSLSPLMGKASAESTDLSDFTLTLSKFQVDGKDVNSGDKVDQDKAVHLEYSWSVPDNENIIEGSSYSFHIPEQVAIPNGFSEPVKFNEVQVGTFTADSSGNAKITFNNYFQNNTLKNRHGLLTVDTYFSSIVKTGTVTQQINFPNDKSYTLSFIPNTSKQDVTKSGITDTVSNNNFNASTITWTSNINTHYDTVKNAVITDTLPVGVADPINIRIYPMEYKLDGSIATVDTANPLKNNVDYSVAIYSANHKFTITFTNDTDNSINRPYQIVYDTTINQDQKVSSSSDGSVAVNPSFTNNIKLDGTNNGVALNGSYIPATVSAKYAPFMTKSSNSSYDPKTQTITWTVKYNFNNSLISSPVLQDVVTGDSGYVDNSLTVKKVTIDSSGNARNPVDDTGNVTNLSADKKSFTITLNNGQPTSDAYLITYKTQAADPKHVTQSTVANQVTSNGKTSKSDIVNIYNVGISKNGTVDPTTNTINWTIDLNQLHQTLTDPSDPDKGPTLTDTFGSGVTGFDLSSVKIKDTLGNELDESNYTVTQNGNLGFTINFHQAINTIEYLLNYATKFDPSNSTASYVNSYQLTYSDGTDKIETGSGSATPSIPEQYNGYKTGSYNAATKTFTWYDVINFDSKSMGNAKVVDLMDQNTDGNGGGNLLLTDSNGNIIMPKVYEFNYASNKHDESDPPSLGQPIDPGPATYTITPNIDRTGFTVQFHMPISKPYVITYQSVPTGVIYADGKYKNHVTLTDASISNDKGTSFSDTETIPYSNTDNYTVKNGNKTDANTVHWKVTINNAQSDVGTNVQLKDELSAQQTYQHNSFHLYTTKVDPTTGIVTKDKELNQSNGDYSVTFTPATNNTGESFVLSFPNTKRINQAYILEYDQNIVRSKGLATVTNSAWLNGSGYVSTKQSYPKDVRIASGSATADGEKYGYVSVGDYVWFDQNRNGIQDAKEAGIPGVKLKISRSDENPVYVQDGSSTPTPYPEQTTDSTGHYEFSNLPALPDGQHYIVSIDNEAQSTKNALNGKVPTLKEQGNDTSKDSSTNSAESKDLKNDGDSDQTLDFGFKVPSVSVGDHVWLDKNRDGIQNSEDGDNPGIDGVKLNLIVVDKDGTVDSSVKNINGETVGPQITSTHDGKAGYYNFTDLPLLPDGEFYQVSIDKNDNDTLKALDNLVPTEPNKTATDKDSSDWTANAVALNNDGESDPTLDFGFVEKSVSVGDYVWKDINRDGIQQDNEPGIKGVQLNIVVVDDNGKVINDAPKNVFGTAVSPQITDENGHYLFPDLPALPSNEHYQVSIGQDQSATALTNLIPTVSEAGTDTEKDSSEWSAISKPLPEDKDKDLSLDFGFIEKAVSVGDYVWKDINRDGIQQDNEQGINGVQVHLTMVDQKGEHPVKDVFGADVIPKTTDNDKDGNKGYYEFTNLPALLPGQLYRVTVDSDADNSKTALNNLIPTLAGQGNDQAKDSSIGFVNSAFLPNNNDNDPTLDFGFIEKKVSVGDYVWKDINRDGIQQDNELGIEGVKLNLVVVDNEGKVIENAPEDVYGAKVEPQTTNEDGHYLFPDLPALPSDEHYQVSIDQDQSSTALTNLIPTTLGAGNDVEKDSSTWTATSKSLTDNEDKDLSLDFGFIEKAVSVGDYVWKDTNRDGIQQDNESGINGVQVHLTMVDQKGEHPVKDVFGADVIPKTTDNDKDGNKGYYEFTNLPALLPGQLYRVTVDSDADSSKTALNNLIPTLAGQGNDWVKDSSTGSSDSILPLTENGAKDLGLDFGYNEKAVLVGDYVWKDVNRNGKQDDGNTGINNVTVKITGPDGKSVTDVYGDLVGEQRTETKDGKNGHYEFDNLPALPVGQHYTVSIVEDDTTKEALTNLIPTQTGQGTKADDSSNGSAESTDLTNDGDSDLTLDFGFTEKSVSVGDYIWLDKNKNGIQDSSESGIENVAVNVTGPDGKPVIDVFGNEVKATKTDSKGHYEFGNLPALPEGQHYTVKIDQDASKDALTNLIPTKEKAGDDSAKDSSTWKIESSDLTKNGDKDLTLDFGFIQKSVSVGDYVWLDKNKDGIQNDNEKGIEDVTITIKGPNGQTVKDNDGKEIISTKTDKDGHYEFTNLPSLPAGEHYTVSIDKDASQSALTNLAPTKEKGSSDKSKDSSTWISESGNLTNDGDKDVSLDFGFIEKSVSVGDYIWLDKNKNGIQDKGESGIPGVVMAITGPDGKPVTDLNGNEVKQVKTDSEGHYEFINLPSLPEGKHYTVSIDRDASKGALKGLVPAKENGINDKSKDSSTWKAESGNLLNDGDKDLTLDFGFVEETVPLVLKGGEPGATYNVVDKNGHVIARGVMADEEGNVNFKGLATGQYHLILVRGVEAETQTSKKANAKGLPITGDTNDIMTMAAGALLLLGGGSLAIFSRRRRKN